MLLRCERRAGSAFWTWLNGGNEETQDWILDAIIQGFQAEVQQHGSFTQLFDEFVNSFAETFARHINPEGQVDWHAILREING